jgi:hypothetical protein
MAFTGKQKIAALLAEKAKQSGMPQAQGIDGQPRSHHKQPGSPMNDMGQQIVNMAKGPKYPNVNAPAKGGLLQGAPQQNFNAMPKFQKLKGLLKY